MVALLSLQMKGRAQWTELVSGIPDVLNDVWFWADTGVVAADHGLWYTTNGGVGVGSWTHFVVNGSPDDLARYAHTRFTALSSSSSNPCTVVVVGHDTVEDKGVLMKVDFSDLSYSFLYVSASGVHLNDVMVRSGGGSITTVVGDDGLILHSINMVDFSVLDTTVTYIVDDLHVISSRNSQAVIVGPDFIEPCSQGSSFSWSVPVEAPGNLITDAYRKTDSQYYGVGDKLYSINTVPYSLDPITRYSPWPLNASSIAYGSAVFLVSTDHGIYRGPYDLTYLEIQPSTIGLDVRKVVFPGSSSSVGYAVCTGGRVLKTTNSGGAGVPYLSAFSFGDCEGESFSVPAFSGSATSCSWRVDGLPVGGYCNVGPIPGLSAGVHTISFIGSNGTYADTVTFTVTTPAPPSTLFEVAVDDTLLCRSGQVSVTITPSEADVEYTLVDITHNDVLGTFSGTGGEATGVTSVIDTTIRLVVRGRREGTNCSASSPDTTTIHVERTHARFRTDLVNADVNEEVNFYQLCTDAAHYAWTFDGGSPATSSLPEPQGVTYAVEGPTQVTLICWSDAACYDTVITEGPFIYSESAMFDSCWALKVHGPDTLQGGFTTERVGDAIDVGDGFVMCGQERDLVLPSRIGRSSPMLSEAVTYLAKYSYSGVLKWYIYAAVDPLSPHDFPGEPALAKATNGDVFFMDIGRNDRLWYHFNDGDSLAPVPTNYSFGLVVMRLNARGRHVWHGYNTAGGGVAIAADQENNVYVSGSDSGGGGNYRSNGVQYPNSAAGSQDLFILKLNGVGELVWQTYAEMERWNSRGIHDMTLDTVGGIYFAGAYDSDDVRFHSTDGSLSYTLDLIEENNVQSMAVLFKYDVEGHFQWCTAVHHEEITYLVSDLYKVAAEPSGGCYVIGRNECPSSLNTVTMGSDGTVGSWSCDLHHFVARFDQDGHEMWHIGSTNEEEGTGFRAITRDTTGILLGGQIGSYEPDGPGGLTSTDGAVAPLHLGWGDFLLASYTYDGVFDALYRSAPAPLTEPVHIYYGFDVFRDTLGRVFVLADYGSDTLSAFGTQLPGDYTDRDAFIACAAVEPCVVLDYPMNTPSADEAPGLLCYPNPTMGSINVDVRLRCEGVLEIQDGLGRTLLRRRVLFPKLIELGANELPSDGGFILIKVSGPCGAQQQRVVLLR